MIECNHKRHDIKEIAVILKKLELGAYGANCYIIGDEETKGGMVIDPGAEGDLIVKHIKALGLTIKTIALTHGHIDHIGGLAAVKTATGAQIVIHADEAAALQKQPFGMMLPKATPKPDRLVKDGDEITIGKLKFKVLHTPGHTQGGMCLYTDGVVFSGDTLFQFSVGRADFPGSDFDQEINSIWQKLMTLPENTVVCPGHGPDTTIGFEKRGNPFLHGER
ncbi:MAG: MBL fold metallo-hydrolase [Dehalococcoidales bacterium]|nr:MBL fold metallo-hydrolase [Dehalococcoidales bacterium]